MSQSEQATANAAPDQHQLPAGDLKQLDETFSLPDGTQARLRAIRPDDKDRLLEAFRNLEPSSIYTRFFGFKKTLSEAELKRATEIDHDFVVSLVVTIEQDGDEIIIAQGGFSVDRRDNPPVRAEVAFVVEEDFHGMGLATRLLSRLIDIARYKGLEWLSADVLAGNTAMMCVFRRCGLPMTETRENGGIHVSLSL